MPTPRRPKAPILIVEDKDSLRAMLRHAPGLTASRGVSYTLEAAGTETFLLFYARRSGRAEHRIAEQVDGFLAEVGVVEQYQGSGAIEPVRQQRAVAIGAPGFPGEIV